ncbi:uncharacterized protein ISCGN_013951 [Ixodes scapularis]
MQHNSASTHRLRHTTSIGKWEHIRKRHISTLKFHQQRVYALTEETKHQWANVCSDRLLQFPTLHTPVVVRKFQRQCVHKIKRDRRDREHSARMAKQYAVVNFTEEDHVSAVPISWLVVDKWSCLWPKDFAGSRLLDAIRDKIDPGANWDRYPVRVLTRCKTYKKALKKSRLAEETSTLETSEFSAPEAETPEDVFTTYDDAPSHRLALPSPRCHNPHDNDCAAAAIEDEEGLEEHEVGSARPSRELEAKHGPRRSACRSLKSCHGQRNAESSGLVDGTFAGLRHLGLPCTAPGRVCAMTSSHRSEDNRLHEDRPRRTHRSRAATVSGTLSLAVWSTEPSPDSDIWDCHAQLPAESAL